MGESSASESRNSDSSDSDHEDEHPEPIYYIVEFTKRGPKSTRSIDIVCKKWVSFNKSTGKVVSKFKESNRGRYSTDGAILIHDLIRMNADAPGDWRTYNCSIKGQAATYEDAEKKLAQLNTKNYVFTSESNVEPEEKAKKIEKYLKENATREKKAELEKKMMEVGEFMTMSQPLSNNNKKITAAVSTKSSEISTSNRPQRDSPRRQNKDSCASATIRRNIERKRTDSTEEADEADDETADEISQTYQQTKRPKIDKNQTKKQSNKPTSPTNLRTSLSLVASSSASQYNQSHDLPKEKRKSTLPSSTSSSQASLNSAPQDNDISDPKVMVKLANMEAHLSTIKTAVAEVLTILKQRNLPQEVDRVQDTFSEKYDVAFPCQSIEELKALDTQLNDVDECRKEFRNLLRACIDTSGGLSKSITPMMKLCVTRDVALKLTAQKQMPKKMVIKEMTFAKMIESVLKSGFKSTITEKNIWSVIGEVLSNAKDWGGHRKDRQKRKEQTNDAPNDQQQIPK